MPNGWQEVYSELTDFIAEHPEVEIGMSVVSIPGNVRPEFYRLFNTVRTAFIEERFPNLLNEATVLNKNYLKVEQEVTELLGLDDVSMVVSLRRFLHDPIELIRGLFDPLFDLLKAKIDIEHFEQKMSRNIETNFRDLYWLGYEKWAVLSLVKLLEADKSFQVILREPSPQEEVIMRTTSPKEQVSTPQESKCLVFQHKPTVRLTVPDFIVHSAKVSRYIALRSELERALAVASNASEKREWYPLDYVVALGPGLTIIYVADNPEELSLVADAKKICRPDLIIECREQKDWYEKEGLEKVKLHYDSLKPTLGTYIVSRQPLPEQASAELVEGIHILTVGFDTTKLVPIVDALTDLDPE